MGPDQQAIEDLGRDHNMDPLMSDQTISAKSTATQPDLTTCRKQLGDKLREAREKAGMSHDAIAQITRITRTYVTALESGDFHLLPGAVFGRGFVRSIARVLDLDAEELSQLYSRCWPASELETMVKAPVAEGAISRKMTGRRSVASEIGSMLRDNPLLNFRISGGKSVALLVSVPLVALALASITAGIKRGSKRVAKPVEAPVAPQTAEVPEVQPVTEAVVAPKAPTDEPAMELHSEKGNFEHVLELVVIEPVKVKLTSDSNQPVIKQLKPDAYRYTFVDRAELTIYDAAAVELAFNGRSLGSLGAKGRIRKLIFQSGAPESALGGAVGKTEKKL